MPEINLTNILIFLGILIVFTLFLFLLFSKSKKRVPKEDLFSETYIKSILLALGGMNNILKMEHVNQRVKCTLLDIKKVSQPQLTELQIPAILAGKHITLLVKKNASEVVRHINTLRNEEI